MIEIERTLEVTAELLQAFGRLMPQLTSFSLAPGREILEAIVTDPDSGLFVARDVQAGIVGSATLACFVTPTGRHAWIEDVIVDEAWRGHGIGEALTRACIERAREMGLKEVNLTSRPSREAANRLYQRMGFQRRETNIYRYPLK
jgi:ribosomal protein S18 acetylase RimI-like enzyme